MTKITFREAKAGDVPAIVAMLADDDLGKGRETLGDPAYLAAFHTMQEEANNTLVVGEVKGEIVAVYQLTLFTGLSLMAMRRAQIEGVRVASQVRGQGLGNALMEDAEQRARKRGAGLLQFSSNVMRDRAHEFYRRLGYEQSHVGFKKFIGATDT